jgi:hypothetical protein
MHERVRFVSHQGKNILFIDLKACTAEQILEIMAEVQKVVTSQPAKSVLSLSDWTDAQITRPLAEQIKKTLVFDQPHVRKTAFVGVDKVPKVFLNAFKTFSRRDFTIFPTLDEAMDWLAEG